jgi:hypothetical protein
VPAHSRCARSGACHLRVLPQTALINAGLFPTKCALRIAQPLIAAQEHLYTDPSVLRCVPENSPFASLSFAVSHAACAHRCRICRQCASRSAKLRQLTTHRHVQPSLLTSVPIASGYSGAWPGLSHCSQRPSPSPVIRQDHLTQPSFACRRQKRHCRRNEPHRLNGLQILRDQCDLPIVGIA